MRVLSLFVRTIDSASNETLIGYSNTGLKNKLDDPDMGYWEYDYYPDGALKTQTDAKNQTTTMVYDAAGRMKSRTDHNGQVSTWVYDTALYGMGQLASESSTNGYSKTYGYDYYGRPESSTTTIDGIDYSDSVIYDALGRISEQTYPSGYTTVNHYHHSLGLLEKVTKAGSEVPIWQAKSFSVRGQLESYKLGTNLNASRTYDGTTGRITDIAAWVSVPSTVNTHYDWDSVGNLNFRSDYVNNVTDTFDYDDLNRLTDMITTGAVNTSQNVTYYDSGIGNIRTKTGLGTYVYGGTCGGVQAGPHAVTSIGNKTYCYDKNGNMTSGDGRTTSYTTFNKPNIITKGSNTSRFWYGPNRDRFKRQDSTTAGTTTTHYVGNYEKSTGAGGTVERIYIDDYAIVIKDAGGEQLNYMITDHLGSVIALTDHIGTVLERFSYDAWGKRRQVNGNLNLDIFNFTSLRIMRGYTGHEMLDAVGLIHMGGRAYDPIIGRFISADPFVQYDNDLQSYNRYSYVLNNPLKYNDPTGYYSEESSGYNFDFDVGTSDWESAGFTGLTYSYDPSLSFDNYDLFNDSDMLFAETENLFSSDDYAGGYSLFDGDLGSGDFTDFLGSYGTDSSAPSPFSYAQYREDRFNDAYAHIVSGATPDCSATDCGMMGFTGRDASAFFYINGNVQYESGMDAPFVIAGRMISRIVLPAVAKAPKNTLSLIRSGDDIVQQVARQQYMKGFSHLRQFMKRGELRAYMADPSKGSRYIGHAVHRATDAELRALYGSRFQYDATRAFDFLDRATGQAIELTTRGGYWTHMQRGANTVLYKY